MRDQCGTGGSEFDVDLTRRTLADAQDLAEFNEAPLAGVEALALTKDQVLGPWLPD